MQDYTVDVLAYAKQAYLGPDVPPLPHLFGPMMSGLHGSWHWMIYGKMMRQWMSVHSRYIVVA